MLAQLLQRYPHRDYILKGFKQGFLLDFEGPQQELMAPNSHSVSQNPSNASEKIQTELSKGRIAGPFPQPPLNNFKCSPLALREKKDPGKYRLLHNLSYPYDQTAVNFNISKANSTVQYQSISDAISCILQCGQKPYMAKCDIADAFRIIPLHPSQYNLTGFYHDGYYYDKCLPMGCASSCKIFEAFSSAIKWILQNILHVNNVIKVLDDFLFINSSYDNCKQDLTRFQSLCSQIGVPLAPHKTVGPATVITFLGIQLDACKMQASLPLDKLQSYSADISALLLKNKVTLRELKSTIGKLQFATAVVTPGKPFLRRMHDLTIKVSKPFHFIRVTKQVKRDLQLWLTFLDEYNGKTMLSFKPAFDSQSLHFFSDASKVGFGATFKNSWIQGLWPEHWSRSCDITFLEFYPIYAMLHLFAHKLAHSTVQFHCDNQAIVHVINNQTSKCNQLMSILRPLVLLLLKHNITLKAVHIPGKNNTLCDLISRQQVRPEILQQYGMKSHPTPLPLHLLPQNFVMD